VTHVSGGEWHVNVDLGFIDGGVSGPESIQDMGSAVVGAAVAYYDFAREGWTDFFTWLDPAGYYDSSCSGGGGR
jgi:hypothetical protein